MDYTESQILNFSNQLVYKILNSKINNYPFFHCETKNILPKELILKKRNIIGNRFYPYFLNDTESFDIDTMDEFNTAEKIVQ